MKRRTLLWLATLLALAVAVAYVRFATPETPAGQPALATIEAAALASFQADFNASADKVRAIVLLSPT